jgi:prepilin-type N-terminal cleavage/methylation domain-containing protein
MRRARRTRRRQEGFTLFEVILALALLGISLLTLVQHSADSTRADADRAARLVAHRTLRNEVQRLRASDPLADPAPGSFPASFFTDRAGNQIDAAAPGSQAVTVSRRIRCLGGAEVRDNATAPSTQAGCGAGPGPVAEFTVRVVFPSRYTEDGTSAVEQTITLWPRDRHGTAWSPAS